MLKCFVNSASSESIACFAAADSVFMRASACCGVSAGGWHAPAIPAARTTVRPTCWIPRIVLLPGDCWPSLLVPTFRLSVLPSDLDRQPPHPLPQGPRHRVRHRRRDRRGPRLAHADRAGGGERGV